MFGDFQPFLKQKNGSSFYCNNPLKMNHFTVSGSPWEQRVFASEVELKSEGFMVSKQLVPANESNWKGLRQPTQPPSSQTNPNNLVMK